MRAPSNAESNAETNADRTVVVLFRSLLALSTLSVLATLFELASLRHWDGTQLIPWLMAGAVLVAIALTAAGTARSLVWAICAVSVIGSLFGVWEHVDSNYESGPLDRQLGPKWDSMSTLGKWWNAFTQTVGPSPALAPMALALAGGLLALARWCRPDGVGVLSRRVAAPGR